MGGWKLEAFRVPVHLGVSVQRGLPAGRSASGGSGSASSGVGQTPPHQILQDMVNERVVRILLECILVEDGFTVKMGIYMAFPVGLFWLFNQPAFFEDWMVEQRKKMFLPSDPKAVEALKKFMEAQEMKRHEQLSKHFDEDD